eukprot:snap_masked-scaffold_58-processed-gene-0.45-mRNA-1 protein AED:1.00 eAED:1.00 QI:0/0/0/0/1/1/2/0/288
MAVIRNYLTKFKRFLSTYDNEAPLLLFTDSSKYTWSIAVFQDDASNVTNDVGTLKPRPLLFLSGGFAKREIKWHISSKELYPLIYSFERIGFLLRTHTGGLYVYIDHKALLTVVRVKENNKRIYWDRLYRWIIRLQSVDLTIFHISSLDNFFSDLLTRWAASGNQNNNIARCSGGFELNDAQFPNKESFYSVSDSIEQLNIQPGDVAEISEVDFTNFNDFFKYEETTILNIRRVNTRSGRDKHLQPKEASVYSTKFDLVDCLQGEYISYISLFYPKGKRKLFTMDDLI